MPRTPGNSLIADEEISKSLSTLVNLLCSKTSHDFTHYKTPTLLRRIRRRMSAAGIEEIEDYLGLLRKDDREIELLSKDLLIHVTSFFRDPAAYDALAKTIIPEVVRRHASGQPIRVWVPGCSSGEEAYSLAMLIFEELAAAKQSAKVQIFASDVSPDAIANGRIGLYPVSIEADVSAERLACFFTREEQGYQVNRDIRDSIVFTVQDVLIDPPFSQLDFISCRNLLIYLQPDEQEKVLALFHFALREDGFLYLGSAETIGKLTDKFEPVSDRLRLFRRLGRGVPQAIATNLVRRHQSLWPRATGQAEPKRLGLGDFVRQLLLQTYAPAAVLVNRRYQAVFFFGPVNRYLLVPEGEPNRDVTAMLRDGLATKFRAALRRAIRERGVATVGGVHIARDEISVTVSISARPVQHEREELFLVTFIDEPESKAVRAPESLAETSRADLLEQELATMRDELECTIRDLETSNQELTRTSQTSA